MANVEYLTKRVDGKRAEIAKLEKKLARIIKAQESGWTVNPYYYREDDLRYTNKELDVARKALAEYEAKLATETEKDASRNIEAIVEFLNKWADRMYKAYETAYNRYLAAKAEYYNSEAYKAYWDAPNYARTGDIKQAYVRARMEFNDTWKFLYIYLAPNGDFDGAKLHKELEQDKKAKYDDLVERVNAICGAIKDASGLRVGEKGEINGLIIGERGNARVETIDAGGYNIQCYHFRTLVHEVK